MMNSVNHIIRSVFNFYVEGFRNMSSWGKRSWLIIILKLFIMFAILKIFFFHNFLDSKFSDDAHKSEYVRNQILKPSE
jgi:hypothetical protein